MTARGWTTRDEVIEAALLLAAARRPGRLDPDGEAQARLDDALARYVVEQMPGLRAELQPATQDDPSWSSVAAVRAVLEAAERAGLTVSSLSLDASSLRVHLWPEATRWQADALLAEVGAGSATNVQQVRPEDRDRAAFDVVSALMTVHGVPVEVRVFCEPSESSEPSGGGE